MQLLVGTYAFPAGGVTVASKTTPMLTDARVPYSLQQRLSIRGYLESTIGQADLTAKENLLRAVLKVPNQPIALYQDSGQPSATALFPAGAMVGPIVDDGPHFPAPDNAKAEYANQRYFEFSASAEYPIPDSSGLIIMSWRETLRFTGGGPIVIAKRATNGPPQLQQVYPLTEYVLMQRGEAVGFDDYPTPPPALYPANLAESPEIEETGPDRLGTPNSPTYLKYRISWSYKMLSVSPMPGRPSLWPY